MTAVILTIHTLIVLGLIGVVLLQRSEGGALGMGGAGSGGGFMSGRAAANALTRTTSVLAALFFATSLGLAITADTGAGDEQAIEELTGEPVIDPDDAPVMPATSTEDLLNSLGTDSADDAGAAPSDAAPLTEAEILDALGSDAPPASEVESEAAPEESDEQPQ